MNANSLLEAPSFRVGRPQFTNNTDIGKDHHIVKIVATPDVPDAGLLAWLNFHGIEHIQIDMDNHEQSIKLSNGISDAL